MRNRKSNYQTKNEKQYRQEERKSKRKYTLHFIFFVAFLLAAFYPAYKGDLHNLIEDLKEEQTVQVGEGVIIHKSSAPMPVIVWEGNAHENVNEEPLIEGTIFFGVNSATPTDAITNGKKTSFFEVRASYFESILYFLESSSQITSDGESYALIIEGHSNPGAIYRAKRNGASKEKIMEMRESSKILSIHRAEEIKKLLCNLFPGFKDQEKRIICGGLGVDYPLWEMWEIKKAAENSESLAKEMYFENSRVEFRLVKVSIEMPDSEENELSF